jgi:hypothetical protein
MKVFPFILLLGSVVASQGQYVTDEYTATTNEVNDGLNQTKPLTPFNFANSKWAVGGGGGGVTPTQLTSATNSVWGATTNLVNASGVGITNDINTTSNALLSQATTIAVTAINGNTNGYQTAAQVALASVSHASSATYANSAGQATTAPDGNVIASLNQATNITKAIVSTNVPLNAISAQFAGTTTGSLIGTNPTNVVFLNSTNWLKADGTANLFNGNLTVSSFGGGGGLMVIGNGSGSDVHIHSADVLAVDATSGVAVNQICGYDDKAEYAQSLNNGTFFFGDVSAAYSTQTLGFYPDGKVGIGLNIYEGEGYISLLLSDNNNAASFPGNVTNNGNIYLVGGASINGNGFGLTNIPIAGLTTNGLSVAPTNGQVLTANGNGSFSFSNAPSGGGGSISAATNFTWVVSTPTNYVLATNNAVQVQHPNLSLTVAAGTYRLSGTLNFYDGSSGSPGPSCQIRWQPGVTNCAGSVAVLNANAGQAPNLHFDFMGSYASATSVTNTSSFGIHNANNFIMQYAYTFTATNTTTISIVMGQTDGNSPYYCTNTAGSTMVINQP